MNLLSHKCRTRQVAVAVAFLAIVSNNECVDLRYVNREIDGWEVVYVYKICMKDSQEFSKCGRSNTYNNLNRGEDFTDVCVVSICPFGSIIGIEFFNNLAALIHREQRNPFSSSGNSV